MQNASIITTTAYLTFTMFQPRLKSGGAGVVDTFGRDIVYEVVAEAPRE